METCFKVHFVEGYIEALVTDSSAGAELLLTKLSPEPILPNVTEH